MCYIIPQSSKIKSVIFNYMSRRVGVFYRKSVWLFKKKNSSKKEKSGYINKDVTAKSALLNEIVQFTMRGQQPFTYLRIPAVKVTIKALTLSNIFENFYSRWGCFCCLCFVLFCLAIFLLPLYLPSLSVTISCFYFFPFCFLAKFSRRSPFY